MLLVAGLLTLGLLHLGLVACQPEGAAGAVLGIGRQLMAAGLPACQAVTAQCQLGRVVVQHHQVAHAGG